MNIKSSEYIEEAKKLLVKHHEVSCKAINVLFSQTIISSFSLSSKTQENDEGGYYKEFYIESINRCNITFNPLYIDDYLKNADFCNEIKELSFHLKTKEAEIVYAIKELSEVIFNTKESTLETLTGFVTEHSLSQSLECIEGYYLGKN